jgi:Acetamidase/Formamidase family
MRTVCKVDVKKPAKEQPTAVHNRWHPDIPSVVTVEPGEVFKVECLDWTGGQVGNNDSADDIHNVDLTQVRLMILSDHAVCAARKLRTRRYIESSLEYWHSLSLLRA